MCATPTIREIMVKTDMLALVPNLAATVKECADRVPELNGIISEHLIPLVVDHLGNSENSVRRTAHLIMYDLMEKGLVTKQQAEIQVCPTVLYLTDIEKLVDRISAAVTLMSRLTRFLGQEVTERVLLQRFIQLSTNKSFYVRKLCASHFGDFCAVVGKAAYENILFPCYLKLCSDEIWGVRKACVEIIMPVSCACPPTKRHNELAPIFAKLLKDDNQWVRVSAFQILGPFISTFADPTITSLTYSREGELVLAYNDGTEFRYTSMAMPYEGSFIDSLMTLEDLEELIEPWPPKVELSDSSWCENQSSDSNVEPFDSDSANRAVGLFNLEPGYININESNSTNADEEEELSFDINVINEMISNVCDYYVDEALSSITGEGVSSVKNETGKLCTNVRTSNCLELRNEHNDDGSNTEIDRECLDQFNSYNYWYVSPDIPLDPTIINAETKAASCQSPKISKEPQLQSNDISDPLLMASIESDQGITTSSSLRYDSRVVSDPITDKIVAEVSILIRNTDLYKGLYKTKVPIHKTTPLKPPIQHVKIEPSQHIVPQFLIEHFVSMTDPKLAENTNNEITYLCAYCLPAVALTLGNKNWHLLKDTLEVLATDMQYKVRRAVATSLHELAMILGPEIATNNLTPIFEGFIKDLDEVRIGVLKHLAHFLRIITPSKRNCYLPRLADFLHTDNETHWRFRYVLAKQLLLAVPLFHPIDANKHISTLAQELLCDKVAVVREVALLLVSELIRHTSSDDALTSRLLVKLAEKFAHSKRWRRRQSFALLCSDLLTSQALTPDQFTSEVMPHLLDLSWDPVANVRLVVARTISQHIVTNEYFTDVSGQHYDGLQTVLRRLQSDKDRDVRDSAVFQKSINYH